jgi:hypothetical protein
VKRTRDGKCVNVSVTGTVVIVLAEGDGKLNRLFDCIKEVETDCVWLVVEHVKKNETVRKNRGENAQKEIEHKSRMTERAGV